MIIEKIHIINFGKLSDFTLELAEGINIIEGSNESGKSTVSAFIKFMFYGLSADAGERARSISWQSGTAAGTLSLREGGDLYRIEREAVTVRSGADGKQSFRERCVVINEETGKPLYKGKVPGEVFFGIPRGVFESTAFIGQLEGTDAGGKTLAEATENILFSADETVNTKKALKKLDEARVFLYHKNRKGGKIYEHSRERAELAEKLTEAQRVSAEIISTEGTLRVCREAKEKAEKRLAEVNADIAAYERYLIKQNYIKLGEENKKSEAAEAELARLSAENRYGAGMTDERFAAKLGEEKLRLITLDTKLQIAQNAQNEARERLQTLKAPLCELPEDISCEELAVLEKDGLKKARTFRSTAIVLSVLTALCALLAFINPFIALAACAAVLAAACVFWVLLALNGKKLRENCYDVFDCTDSAGFRAALAARQSAEAEVRYAERTLDEAAGRSAQIKAQCDSTRAHAKSALTSAKFATTENLLADIEKAEEEARSSFEKRRVAAREKAAADAKIAEIVALLEDIPEQEKERALCESFDEEAMRAFDLRAKKRDSDFIAKSIAAQTEKIHTLECELAALGAQGARPAEIAQAINALSAKIDEYSEKFEAYMLAIDAINSASGKLRDGISPQIAKGASALMQGLSGGKYGSVFVDSDFAMSYSADGITRDVATLSAGTSDIAYISLRLALAETLCKHKMPPFVFDESFTRMDDTRLTAALKILEQKFEKNAQAIVFTCHGRESNLAKNTVKATSLSI
ncbi:MAG: AAA family ATPase [Clostridia bacterium]|nr:AAA family ATPase [Clostridia bacterium]